LLAFALPTKIIVEIIDRSCDQSCWSNQHVAIDAFEFEYGSHSVM
jgi:hypothetical protein